MYVIIATVLWAQPSQPLPVRFDALTPRMAEVLDGRLVVATFTVGSVPYTWGEGAGLRTVTAPSSVDSLERTVILKGDRLRNADRGARVRVWLHFG